MPKAKQIVRLIEVSDQDDVALIPRHGDWRFLISHPGHKNRSYYYVSVSSALIIERFREAGLVYLARLFDGAIGEVRLGASGLVAVRLDRRGLAR